MPPPAGRSPRVCHTGAEDSRKLQGLNLKVADLAAGTGEALGLVSLIHLRLLPVYLVYALAAGACSEPEDLVSDSCSQVQSLIPFDFVLLMFAYKIRRGGLKPRPLPAPDSFGVCQEERPSGRWDEERARR
jgi:hypothetical protein